MLWLPKGSLFFVFSFLTFLKGGRICLWKLPKILKSILGGASRILKNMKQEYEAKFLDINQDRVKSFLENLGAKKVKEKTLLRRVIFESDITYDNHSWIRLRDEGNKITLTLKQVSDASTIHGTKELEIIVDNFEKTSQFLEKIGLTKKRYQENYREEWQLNDIIFDFDTWPDMPILLEIEGPNETSIKNVARKLGFDYSTAKFGSIDNIYLERYGRDILKEPTLVFEKTIDRG